ncbi:acyl-CoA dehydrogenase [Nocardioides salsibiostraticola]
MSIGISEEHRELAATLAKWAASLDGIGAARAAENDRDEGFSSVWEAVSEMGLPALALPEHLQGGGGTTLDTAVALEACAGTLIPGGLLATTIAAHLVAHLPDQATAIVGGARVALALDASLSVVWDAPGADAFLVPDDADEWHWAPADAVTVTAGPVLDLTRRSGSLVVDWQAPGLVPLPGIDLGSVRRTAVTFAAAEAAGVARWCLATAVDYAKVREQFGRPIGSFQAIKHLCAEMLETAEAVTAVAWDVAAAAGSPASSGSAHDVDAADQWAFAADVAEAIAFEGAVSVAKTCIQVLGGIGFTHEHDAHLYLRRALTLRALVGRSDDAAARLTERAVRGVRRRPRVDLEGRDEVVRDDLRALVAEVAAAEDQRLALVDTGVLTPHWPAPAGLGADAVTQIVLDQELAAADVVRPDLVIATWALPSILERGTPAQRERFVRPSLLGDIVWCQLFSEPGSGSDLASLRTKAERVDGGWRLTGQKVWTSVAERAHWGICLARTDPEAPQHRGISYFLVDMSSPGIDIRPLREITGEALFNEVFLDNVFVPDDAMVGEPGEGWKLARTTLANERVAMASSRLDKSAERAVALAAESENGIGATDRVRIGHAVALSTVNALLGTRSTLRSLSDAGPGPESSVAKLLGVRNRQDSAELVVDLYGDRVLTDDPEVAAAVWEMLNTRCLSIAGGTTQILRNVAGERILGLPR